MNPNTPTTPQLDPDAVNLAKAIRQTESGGNFQAKGKSGEYGAYQYTKDTWTRDATASGVNVPLEQSTPQQQNEVAYKRIKSWKDKGYNVGQIASMWNAGEGAVDAYKDPTFKGTNKSGAHYDVPAYAKSVATAYQTLKQGGQVGIDPNNPSSTANTTPQEQPKVGFLQGLIRGVASPVLRGVANIASLADVNNPEELNKDMSQGVNFGDYLGSYRPIGATKDVQGKDVSFGHRLADTIGTGAEAASYVVPLGEAANLAEKGLAAGAPEVVNAVSKGRIIKGAVQGAKTGGIIGGLAGTGQGLQDPNATPGSVIGQGLLGGVEGGATGGILGGTSGMLGKLSKTARTSAAVEDNLKNLTELENANKSLRNLVADAKSDGIDIKDLVANTDLLHGAVDTDGVVRTKQDGGALAQLDDFMSNKEGVIKNNLVKEGKTINLKDVQSQLEAYVNGSNLEGAALERAHADIKAELAGYARKADKNGNIALAKIQDAKINKTRTLNYDNPESQAAGKTVAGGLKDIIEKNTGSVDVKNVNNELKRYYHVRDFLESLDGKKVSGGRLGKYFAKTTGAIAGSHFGPLGPFIGSEVAGKVQGLMMAGKFGNKTGKALQESPLMKDAIARGEGLIRKLPVKELPSEYAGYTSKGVKKTELPEIKTGKKPPSKFKKGKGDLPSIKY